MKESKKYTFVMRDEQEGGLLFLGAQEDATEMNWAAGHKKWGTVICPEGVESTVIRTILPNGHLQERYSFKNSSNFPVFFEKTAVGIYATFHDDYQQADECMTKRCHTHIFCGGESSYVMAVRMGGEPPHLGLVVKMGGLGGYSIERTNGEQSNDRGDFILHPTLKALNPGEVTEIVWELFWFENRKEFEECLIREGKTLVFKTQQCTYFPGETIAFDVLYGKQAESSAIIVTCNKEPMPFQSEWDGTITRVHCEKKAEQDGEYEILAKAGTRSLRAVLYVSPDLRSLVRSRCEFLAAKQQYHGEITALNGAYLIYDNEEETIYYSHRDDHNGGRERVVMGTLMALWLQKEEVPHLRESLDRYMKYIDRELYDEKTGVVYNDISRNLDWHRKYNYPMVAVLQIEMYHLTKEMRYLKRAYSIMKRYYLEGGDRFYAVGIPACELLALLEKEHMDEQFQDLKTCFIRHADYILERGISYPPHEVNFEQGIVAPGASYLLQAYQITKEPKYLDEAQRQLCLLSQFNGQQPDYHQYENAIRHWDGYWFGKRRLLGDTYPHYWSVLTGIAYAQHEQVTGAHTYREKARASFRGCLNLFTKEGRASCAMVFPQTVNGEKGDFYDPWANDQDWALYYALKYESVTR